MHEKIEIYKLTLNYFLIVKNILTYYPKEVSFLRRVKDDSLAAGGR
ncbi:hypothetical protein P4256_05200 [Bacillus wiedmannii]|nr:hypothetical protein [Bacillus wiedmannii]